MPSSPGQSDDSTTIVSLGDSLSTTHASCPPEEERQSHAPTEGDNSIDQTDPDTIILRQQSPSDDAEEDSSTESEDPATEDKHMSEADPSIHHDPPSPTVIQDESRDGEAGLAQSMSAAALSPRLTPELLAAPDFRKRITPNSTSSFLRPGSKFVGTQQSDRQVYNVQVEIKHVDMDDSFLCGYLRIQGLTDDHPTLTTYFESEIIGNKHTFKTSHAEWGSSEKVDMQHWNRFPAWRPLAKQAKSPAFTFKNYAQREHLFMRWKEYFLVPDHKVKTITGASFEGFYYICFNQCTGSVSGIYFHAKSEKYQQLELEHVNDRGCTEALEFR